MSRHQEPRPKTFQTPENIGEILDNDLFMIQAGRVTLTTDEDVPDEVRAGNTDIFEVRNRDDLIVRRNRSDECRDHLRNAVITMAYESLAYYDVNVVPFNWVVHEGEGYTVAQKVEGDNLNDALKTIPADTIAPMVDKTWSGLVSSMADGYRDKSVMPDDIVSPDQYMYGRTANESEDKIWLVDIGESASIYNPTNYMYEEMILTVAGHVVELESSLGRELKHSREALIKAFEAPESAPRPLELSEYYKQAILKAAEYSIKNKVVIDYQEEDRILELGR